MFRHVINIVVILDKSICMLALLMSSIKAASEDFGVFVIEMNENPSESNFLSGVLPETLITLSLGQELHDPQFAPVAKSVLVFPKTLRANPVSRSKRALLAYPGLRESCIELLVVVSF